MWPRKSSLSNSALKAQAAAPNPAPAVPITIPEVSPPTAAVPLESLIPRDFVFKNATFNEVTLQYSLPPTSTSLGGPVDVRIFVRPAKIYKETYTNSREKEKLMSSMSMEHNMNNMKNLGKPGYDSHESFMKFSRESQAVRTQIRDYWDAYASKCKELLPPPEGATATAPYEGFVIADIENHCYISDWSRSEVLPSSVKASPETHTVVLKNIASNVMYEVMMKARRQGPVDSDNPDNVWGPSSTIVSFSTKPAPWQLALEKAGLRFLIEPFNERGYDTFQSWLDIPNEVKLELDIDSTVDQQLQDILSQNGVITPLEQLKIERERTEMVGVIATLLSELAKNKDQLTMGDGVVEKVASNKKRGPRFGVVVKVDGESCSVRFEDPRTKDPANAEVEKNVKVSNLNRAGFSVFMSHAQHEAQNQVAHLSVLLRDQDAKIWFDMDSERLEARDMVRGIANSKVFLLYLTKSYFDRYFCRMECSVAKALNKPLIVVYEPDERHGGEGDYGKLVNLCTKKFPEFKEYLMSTEAIPMARRSFQRRAVVDEICKRAGVVKVSHSNSDSAVNKGATSEATSLELGDLRQMIIDMRMEINDLKAENQALKSMFEDFTKN